MAYQTPSKASIKQTNNQTINPIWSVKIDRVSRLTASQSGLQNDVIQLPADQAIKQSISVNQKLLVEILDPSYHSSVLQSPSSARQSPSPSPRQSISQPIDQPISQSKFAVVKSYHHPSLSVNTCRFQVCVNQSINETINQSIYQNNPMNLLSTGQTIRIHRLPFVMPIAQSIKLSTHQPTSISVNVQSYINQSISQSVVFVGQHLIVSLFDRYYALTVESIESDNQTVNKQITDQSINQSSPEILPTLHFADSPRITIVKRTTSQPTTQSSNQSIGQSVDQSTNQLNSQTNPRPTVSQSSTQAIIVDATPSTTNSAETHQDQSNDQSLFASSPASEDAVIENQTANQSISHSSNQSVKQTSNQDPVKSSIDFSMIGGLEKELHSIRQMIELPLLRPEVFSAFGVRPPRGLLLYGPPGCGKTLIARSIYQSIKQSNDQSISFFHVNGSEIHSAFVGESEERLRSIFTQAVNQSPSILFIDEIDCLCPSRDQSVDQLSKRLVSTLLTAMDGIRSVDRLIVIGATNRPDSIDAAMRRPGRFDREIELSIPSVAQRTDILTKQLKNIPNNLSIDEIDWIAQQCHGFVGADLKALCREAATHVVRSIHQAQSHNNNQTIDQTISQPTDQLVDEQSTSQAIIQSNNQSINQTIQLSFSDLKYALTRVQPSSMREHLAEIPRVRWSDIGGQQSIKQRLIESVDWPLTHPAVFTRLGISPPKGVLLYGPPGCSKTLMAKALACESSRNYLSIKGPELLSKWVGDSEKAVKNLFRKARAAAPCILFFDEIDSIAASRSTGDSGSADRVSERVLSQLLQELDGFNEMSGVFVLAATNRPDRCDAALLRPGRIDRILYVSPPERADECAILDIELARMEHDDDVAGQSIMEQYDVYCQNQSNNQLSTSAPFSFDSVKSNTPFTFSPVPSTNQRVGYTGAELAALCREAALAAIDEDRHAQKVTMKHFIRAFSRVQPRLTRQQIDFYDNYAAQSGLTSV